MDGFPLPYSDRCGTSRCVHLPPVDENPVRVSAAEDGDGYLANYVCSRCGYEWATSWMARQYDETADQRMRSLAAATQRSGVPMLPPGGRRYPTKRSA